MDIDETLWAEIAFKFPTPLAKVYDGYIRSLLRVLDEGGNAWKTAIADQRTLIEVTFCFCGLLALCDYLQSGYGSDSFREKRNRELREQLPYPSAGTWRGCLVGLPRKREADLSSVAIPELFELAGDRKIYRLLEGLIVYRNDIIHGGTPEDPVTCKSMVEEHHQEIEALYKALRMLSNYSLCYVNSDTGDGYQLSIFAGTGDPLPRTVKLRRSPKIRSFIFANLEKERFLDLDPFIRKCPECQDVEDILIYISKSNTRGELEYSSGRHPDRIGLPAVLPAGLDVETKVFVQRTLITRQEGLLPGEEISLRITLRNAEERTPVEVEFRQNTGDDTLQFLEGAEWSGKIQPGETERFEQRVMAVESGECFVPEATVTLHLPGEKLETIELPGTPIELKRRLPFRTLLRDLFPLKDDAAYFGFVGFGGYIFSQTGTTLDQVFIGYILAFLVMVLGLQFRRAWLFDGRWEDFPLLSKAGYHGALLFTTLMALLNAPLLMTSYTGMDPYGFFALHTRYSKSMVITEALLVNLVLAFLATALFLALCYWRDKRNPDDIALSTFIPVIPPIFLVYLVVAFFGRLGFDLYFVVALFPFVLAFLAVVGYTHPKNQVDLFTAKLLLVVCIVFSVVGFLSAAAGLLVHFATLQPRLENVFESRIWTSTFSWEKLGYTNLEAYSERYKSGFIWMVLTSMVYLELVVATVTTLTIYTYQYEPARKR